METNLTSLAQKLNTLGFRYVTYGWDQVIRSTYYGYINDSQSFEEEGEFVFPQILEEGELPDFYYAREVEEGDIEQLAEAGMLDDLLAEAGMLDDLKQAPN